MFFAIVVCATTLFCATDPAVQSQLAATPQAAVQSQAAKSAKSVNASAQQANPSAAAAKKAEPQVRTPEGTIYWCQQFAP